MSLTFPCRSGNRVVTGVLRVTERVPSVFDARLQPPKTTRSRFK